MSYTEQFPPLPTVNVVVASDNSDVKDTDKDTTQTTSAAVTPVTTTTTTTTTTPANKNTTAEGAPYQCRATQTFPRFDLLPNDSSPVAVDIEFQEFKKEGNKKWSHRIGCITIVNVLGQTILDVYAYYPISPDEDKKLPPQRLDLGVRWKDLQSKNGAKPAQRVEKWCRQIFKGRKVILWGGRIDRMSFQYERDAFEQKGTSVVDLQVRNPVSGGKGLADAVWMELEKGSFRSGSCGGHTSLEDAKATMDIWLHRTGGGKELDNGEEYTPNMGDRYSGFGNGWDNLDKCPEEWY